MHSVVNPDIEKNSRVSASHAFTRGDLIIFLGALVLMMLTVLPSVAGRRDRSDRVICMNNLKRIGQAFLSWSEDHNDQFQLRTDPRNGGSFGSTLVFEHFRALSNYISSPSPLVCPGLKRSAAATFPSLRDANISYSLNVHAQPIRPQSMLCTDWDIEGSDSGVCSVTGQIAVQAFRGTPGIAETFFAFWSATNHGRSGQVLTSDGAVQTVDAVGLRRAISKSLFENDNTEHILVPR